MSYLRHDPVSRRAMLATLAAAIAAGCAPKLAARECERTSRAVQGPYWRPDAPFTNDLRRAGGTPIAVRGVVRDAECKPVAGALLDVWQADEHGKYDLEYDRGETFLRARIRTARDGSFAFQTIRPAAYGVGSFLRPAHIHFIVAAGDRRLVAQLYFEGDPHLADDPLGAVHADLVKKVVGGEVRFDVTV